MTSDFCIFFPSDEGGRENVLNYAGCFSEAAGSVDRVSGWEAGLRDGLGFSQELLQFFVVLDRAGAIQTVIKRMLSVVDLLKLVRFVADMPNFLSLLRK